MKLTVSKLRDLEKQLTAGEISYGRMVELINEQVLCAQISDHDIQAEAKHVFSDPDEQDCFEKGAKWMQNELLFLYKNKTT